jgi:translation initiation factor IF-3
MIVNLFSRNFGLTLRQRQAKLKQKGLNISHVTIRTHLRAHSINCRSTTIKKPLLSEKHVKKRLAWTLPIVHWIGRRSRSMPIRSKMCGHISSTNIKENTHIH